MISEKDVFRASCGVDSKKNNKSIIKVETKIIDVGSKEENIVQEVTMDGPVVNIFRSLRYTMVDFQFPDNSDYDFVHLMNMLQSFSTPENSLDTNSDKIPTIQITVMPKELEGMYYVAAVHGTWCIMPSRPGKLADTVRFIYDNELIHTYRLNEKAVDEDEIETELYLEQQYGEKF